MITHQLLMTVLAAPNPAPQPPPGVANFASTVIAWAKWVGIIAAVLALIVSGIMMMIGRRNRSQIAVEGASGVPWVIAGLIVIVSAVAIVGAVLPG